MSYYTTKSGYERFETSDNATTIHQLIMVAEGKDPEVVYSNGVYNIHHKNEIPWDNRPENLDLLTKGEHNSKHWDPGMLMGEYITADVCEAMRDKYREVGSMGAVSEDFDCSKKTVHMHLKGDCSHNCSDLTPNQKGPRDGPWKDESLFREKYVQEAMTLSELAELWDASQACMSYWKQKHDI